MFREDDKKTVLVEMRPVQNRCFQCSSTDHREKKQYGTAVCLEMDHKTVTMTDVPKEDTLNTKFFLFNLWNRTFYSEYFRTITDSLGLKEAVEPLCIQWTKGGYEEDENSLDLTNVPFDSMVNTKPLLLLWSDNTLAITSRIVLHANGRILSLSRRGSDISSMETYLILMRFRNTVGIVGDIREMFNQINILADDAGSQRFVWRGKDRLKDPDEYGLQRCK
ncbi:unnamed protein product [Allacma fusca]|uniref:Uncharacterized protein n=1 Tax=Allacma fusca TaxID=39272 RepID=A0A8J2KPH2_9HEXA|nr:unnamed protein product [Allacma fusca]